MNKTFVLVVVLISATSFGASKHASESPALSAKFAAEYQTDAIPQLVVAVMWGDLNRVKVLIAKGVDLNAKDGLGMTALMWASNSGRMPDIVKVLIAAGADVNAKENDGKTALTMAANLNDRIVVGILIAAEANVNAITNSGWTALLESADVGDSDVVHELIAAGADTNAVDKTELGRTPLMNAAARGDAEIVRALIAAGANVNTKDKFGNTAVILAAEIGDGAAFNALVAAGAHTAPLGLTPLMRAVIAGDATRIKTLIRRGDHINEKDRYGDTALLWGASMNNLVCVSFLIGARSNLNAKNLVEGLTPLMRAIRAGHEEIALQLIAAGADVNAKSNMGYCALDLAAQVGNVNVVKKLIGAGAHVNTKGPAGWSPLMWAVNTRDQPDCLTALISAGAEVNAQYRMGSTALIHAATLLQPNSVRSLLAAGAAVNAKDDSGSTALSRASESNFLTRMGEEKLHAVIAELKAAGAKS